MPATTTFEAGAFSATGTARERITLPADLFDGTVNVPVMHQAVKAFLANQRQGNAATKNRKWVTGGNQKPWRQKGTGRARQGSIRAPHWVGGGTVFGPQPRAYDQFVPKQVRALARKSALNARAREGAIYIVDRLGFTAPKTAQLRDLIAALGLGGQKVLVLTDGPNPNVYKSGRNLPSVHVMAYRDVSAYHLLWCDAVMIESAAIGRPLEPLGGSEPVAPATSAPERPAPGGTRQRASKARGRAGATSASDDASPKRQTRRKKAED